MRVFLTTVLFTVLSLVSFVFAGNDQAGGRLAAACAACHGPNGNSPVPIYPKLAGQNEKYFIEQMRAFKEGKEGPRYNPIMQNFAVNLTEQQIRDLAAYYAKQKVKVGKTDPDYLKEGKLIYQAGIRSEKIPACSACHGPAGKGNANAPFPAVSGQHADYVLQQLEAYKQGTRKSGMNNIMSLIAKQMNKEQMQAAASYIAGLH
jgi:cytochrome c553